MEREIYLFRHGECVPQKTNSGLTYEGVEQARRLGRRLKTEGIVFDAVYTSSIRGASETAVLAVAEIFPLDKVVEIPELGESLRMTERRISNLVEDEILYNPRYLDAHSKIAIFTHETAIKCFLHYVMGYSDRFIQRMDVDNASLTKVDFKNDDWWVRKINDTSHLVKYPEEEYDAFKFNPEVGEIPEGIFAMQLIFHRNKLGFSRAELARAVGIDYSYLFRLEKGDRRVGRKTLINLVKVLNLSLDQANGFTEAAGYSLESLKIEQVAVGLNKLKDLNESEEEDLDRHTQWQREQLVKNLSFPITNLRSLVDALSEMILQSTKVNGHNSEHFGFYDIEDFRYYIDNFLDIPTKVLRGI